MRAAALGLLLWLAAATAWAQTFPKLTGRVVDQAGVLSPVVEADLTTRLAAAEARNGAQVVVATVSSLQGYEIEEYGYRLGRAWGLGEAEKDNGAILLVAPAERRVRVEVGYGLEPVLTDALSSVILQQQVLPRFRAGEMEAGVVAGADAIIEQVSLEPGEARARVLAAEERQRTTSDEEDGGIGVILLVLFVVFVILPMLSRRGRGRRRRGGGGLLNALLWAAASSSWSGGGGGGRGGGWGGGGGGFRGGGGSFGGGGASGGW